MMVCSTTLGHIHTHTYTYIHIHIHSYTGTPLFFNLVELGAGDGHKTSVLLEHFADHAVKFRYTSVDISEGALRYQASLLLG
jgi:uncharacterized SAM-dependent methyltransferase